MVLEFMKVDTKIIPLLAGKDNETVATQKMKCN